MKGSGGEIFILKIALRHRFAVSIKQAKAIQLRLRKKIMRRRSFSDIRTIAAADASFRGGRAIAAVAVFTYPELELIECQTADLPLKFPYVPGLLTFREGPVLLKAFQKIKCDPALIIFDGQGVAHPQRLGIATHMGIMLDKPTIGSAKSRLIGKYNEPGIKRGSVSPLRDGKEVIGAVLRTQDGVKPIFVSIGQKIDLKTAVKIILSCARSYRLPDPIRFVHNKCSARP